MPKLKSHSYLSININTLTKKYQNTINPAPHKANKVPFSDSLPRSQVTLSSHALKSRSQVTLSSPHIQIPKKDRQKRSHTRNNKKTLQYGHPRPAHLNIKYKVRPKRDRQHDHNQDITGKDPHHNHKGYQERLKKGNLMVDLQEPLSGLIAYGRLVDFVILVVLVLLLGLLLFGDLLLFLLLAVLLVETVD